MASGAGYFSAAVITTALVLFSLWPLRIFAFRVVNRFRPETDRLIVQLPTGESPAPLIEKLESLGGDLQSLEVGHEHDRRTVLVDVTLPPKADAPAIVSQIARARARAGGPLERLTVRLCSRNRNKLRELSALLPGWELELLDADGYPPEGSDSYYENARAKAVYGRSIGPAEEWMLGEDSGLEVAALGGAPGVRSARYGAEGGEAIERLLSELEGVADRRARYVCELVLIGPDGEERRGSGVLDGRIAEQPRGSEGFGYDPVFLPAGEDATVAELGNDWKRRNSHRARAAANLQ